MAITTSRTTRRSSQAQKQGNPSKRFSASASWHEPNFVLVGILMVLVVFGLVMLSSASSVEGFQKFGDPNFFVKHQLLYGILIGIPALWIMSRIDYHLWKHYAFPLIITAIVLSFLVLVPGIGVAANGANRWLSLGGITFQPSELVKLFFLIYLGVWLEARQKDIHDSSTGLIPFLIMVGILVFLIAVLQSDLGTMIVISVIAVSAYFVAGAPWKHLAIIAGLGSTGLLFFIKILPALFPSFAYRAIRFRVFLNPDLDPLGFGYQINQALLAVGSGGILGLGLGRSRQKFNYLPEAESDAIFAVIAEEMGFIITTALILIFIAFMVQGYKIAKSAPDMYGKVLATGITTWIMFQAIVNIMSMLSLMPLTGIPLPFISYGSTSLVTLLAAVGILINISRQTE